MNDRPLTILSVAYPFAPVRPDTAGGAEQVLLTLDRALVASGHRSVVIAQAGSTIAGELIAGPVGAELSDADRTAARRQWADLVHRETIRIGPDVIHLHGIDFNSYLPPPGPSALVTLHLPLAWYSSHALPPKRPGTYLHPVSSTQVAGADYAFLLPAIENGVAIPDDDIVASPRAFALMLTRICPEKGVHLAIDAAKRAGIPLVIAGTLFPYDEHRRYFNEEVAPLLDDDRRFIGPVGGAQKQRLLATARCVLVASTVAETSSLVAREALAAGTPVIAFARGALVETIAHGRTGFLVETVDEMADAIGRVDELDPHLCRETARARFNEKHMIQSYLDLYRRLPAGQIGSAA